MKDHKAQNQKDEFNSNNSDIEVSDVNSILNKSIITPTGNKKQ